MVVVWILNCVDLPCRVNIRTSMPGKRHLWETLLSLEQDTAATSFRMVNSGC